MAERVRSLGQFAGTMVQKKAAILLSFLGLFAVRLGLPAHNTTRFFSSIRPESPRSTQDLICGSGFLHTDSGRTGEEVGRADSVSDSCPHWVYRLTKTEEFPECGRLRNQIMHLAVPDGEFADVTLHFCFEMIQPVVQDFGKESLVNYAEEWDNAIRTDGYLSERLLGLGIKLPST